MSLDSFENNKDFFLDALISLVLIVTDSQTHSQIGNFQNSTFLGSSVLLIGIGIGTRIVFVFVCVLENYNWKSPIGDITTN